MSGSVRVKEAEGIKDVLVQCVLSSKVAAKTLFPERFKLPFSALHDVIWAALDSGHQKIAIAAPRGFGKSTIANIAFPAKKILFQETKFFVPISCTASQAILQAEDLKFELTTNDIVKDLFGPMKSKEQFSKDLWVTETGIMVLPRGAGQQIRGIRHQGHRPDLIVCDDLEDSESVLNEDNRKKLKQWFFSDVLNSVDRSNPNWKVVVIGTVLHEDSLLENLLNDEDWFTIRLELCNDEYESNWPDFMTTEQVKQLVEAFRKQGLLDVFYREYRNIPISREDATFKQEYFKYYEETDKEFLENELRDTETVILVDPAKTVKIHSAHSAVVAVGINMKSNKFFIRDVDARMMYPDQIYDSVFEMAKRFKTRVVGIEVTSLNEFITYPFRNEMLKRGQMMNLIELKARGKKEDRIAQMVPFYRGGHVYHNKTVVTAMEEQLLTFPRCRRFDIIDAVAYFIEIMEEGNRYFLSDQPDDDEFKDLDDDSELPTLKNFRIE